MIGAIVLAAGSSRRMGTQKLLLPLAGKPVIAHVVDELLRSPVDAVLVVVGRDNGRTRAAVGSRRVTFVANPNPDEGMLSSVRCGLRALSGDCEAVVVALGDQPGVSAEVVSQIIQSFRSTGRGIVVPVHQGRRGHPLLISMGFRDEILNHFDAVGLRGLLESHPDEVLEEEVPTPAILEDMDTQEDYERIVSRFCRAPT
jgi:molybdenum cofactor cytidylyltransferase